MFECVIEHSRGIIARERYEKVTRIRVILALCVRTHESSEEVNEKRDNVSVYGVA